MNLQPVWKTRLLHLTQSVSLIVRLTRFIILSHKLIQADVQRLHFYLVPASRYCPGCPLFGSVAVEGGVAFCPPVLVSLGGYPAVPLSPQPQADTRIITDSTGPGPAEALQFSCQLCLNCFFKTEISDRSHRGPLISQMTCR